MKKNLLFKVAAVLTMLTLALVITGVPGTALAAVSGVTITSTGGASYNIPVGGTVELNAIPTGTFDGTRTNVWSVDVGGANVSLSSTSADSTTVTGVNPGTSATVKITMTDGATGTPYTATAVINVTAMTISDPTASLDGGSSKTLTVGNVATGSTTTWTSSRDVVATVNSSGLVSAVGAGTAIITATNGTQSKTCTVTVNPIVTITPTTQNITAASTAGSIQLMVQYGGDLVGSLSSVSWLNSNATAGSLTSAPTSFTVVNPTTLTCTATFLSNATGVNATSNVSATIAGSGYTTSKTSVVNVRTARYYTLEGDSTLNNSDSYGDYTLTLHEANGTVVNDDTSVAHWSWSSSYLSVSSAALNDNRAVMTDGVARIQLYARYNTPSSGTRIYAWINSDSGNKVYTSVVITGLSSLPQTGQDMTMVYVLGGTAAALLAAAGVWYGIRKKRTVA